jgi:hypothetical protein
MMNMLLILAMVWYLNTSGLLIPSSLVMNLEIQREYYSLLLEYLILMLAMDHICEFFHQLDLQKQRG